MPAIQRRTSGHASAMRRNRTVAEDRFWQAVRNRRLGGYKFRFQHSIAPYVADFACLEARLLVEIDGSQHGEEVDAARTAALTAQGFTVLRFWNNEVMQQLDGVLTAVLAACDERVRRGRAREGLAPSPHPGR
jgi:very-short-patch-repair endonuclease